MSKPFEILHSAKLKATSADGRLCWFLLRREDGFLWIELRIGIGELKIDASEEDGILVSVSYLVNRMRESRLGHDITPELESEIIALCERFQPFERENLHEKLDYDSQRMTGPG
jgi:hypothetical protein